jgi:hypothetical protein
MVSGRALAQELRRVLLLHYMCKISSRRIRIGRALREILLLVIWHRELRCLIRARI